MIIRNWRVSIIVRIGTSRSSGTYPKHTNIDNIKPQLFLKLSLTQPLPFRMLNLSLRTGFGLV